LPRGVVHHEVDFLFADLAPRLDLILAGLTDQKSVLLKVFSNACPRRWRTWWDKARDTERRREVYRGHTAPTTRKLASARFGRDVALRSGVTQRAQHNEAQSAGADLLVAGHRGAQISERQGSAQLRGQSVSGEDALDPIDQRGFDESETLRQVRGGDQTDRHGLAVQVLAVTGDVLDRVAESVAEVKEGTTAFGGGFDARRPRQCGP
jgi:hypothetical protein